MKEASVKLARNGHRSTRLSTVRNGLWIYVHPSIGYREQLYSTKDIIYNCLHSWLVFRYIDTYTFANTHT